MNAPLLREIDDKGISPEEFFTLSTKELINKTGLTQEHDFDKMVRDEALSLANQEWNKIKNHNIKIYFLLDDNYPQRLAEIEFAPIILYQLGETDLDEEHILSIVGTRKPTIYGVDFCNRLIEEVSEYFPGTMIVSGLAYGVDSVAHRKALEKGLPTVAVVAHGLNMIYPAANRNLAKEIIKSGGSILSEYPFDVKPFKGNFLARNRIVAALSDGTVIVESNIKGGAMSTANYAFMFNRDVMALPGRSTDELSSGCNLLIRKNKAHLIESAADLIEVTGWRPLNMPVTSNQRNLFPELEGDARKVYEFLKFKAEAVQLDVLANSTGIPVHKLMAVLSDLEFEGIVVRHPGNRYSVS